MSIKHIDELTATDMMRVVKSLPSSTTTLKYDGANLWFGIDQQGVFVSRAGKNKSASRIYTPGDFEAVAPNDQFVASLQALQAVGTKLSEVLDDGDLVEVEVIFGKQPNVIEYNNTDELAQIILIRGVNGTPYEKVVKLGSSLANETISVEANIRTSNDGVNVEIQNKTITFTISTIKRYDTAKIVKSTDIAANVLELQKAMDALSGIPEQTNAQLELSKTTETNKRAKIDCEIALRKRKKSLKMAIYGIMSKFFKQDGLIEGFVISLNDEMYKIVDTDVFIPIKNFFQKGRKQAICAVLTTAPTADMLKRGGIVGDTLIQIATVLGNPDFARAQTVKTSLDDLGYAEFIKQFKINDFNATKIKIIKILENGIKLLLINNSRFQTSKGGTIKVNDSVVAYSSSVIDKTNVASAEAVQKMTQMKNNVVSAKTADDIISAVFGRFVALNKKVVEGISMIGYMLLEDEAGDAPEQTNTTPTSAGDVATKDVRVGGSDISRYKFLVRKRNTSVIQDIKKKKLKIKKD